MIQNGDFECDLAPADSYDVFYWDGTDGVYAAAVSPGSNASAQAISLSCDTNQLVTTITQTLIEAVDPTYILSFDYMVANVSADGTVTLSFDSYGSTSADISASGGPNVDSNNNVLYTWQSAVLAWQFSDEPELDISIECTSSDSVGTFLIDNVAITALPLQPAGACVAQGDNLIANSNFEFDTAPADSIDIWCWTSIGSGSAVPVSPGFNGSTQAVSMTAGAELEYPSISVIYGRQYNISLYYLDPSGSSDAGQGLVTINMCNEDTSELSTSQDPSGWTFATVLYRISETDCYPGVTALLIVSQSGISIDNVSVVLLPVGFCELNNNNLLLNGDFECDDSVDYAANIVEWEVEGDASVQATISYDESTSSEVVKLSCTAFQEAAIYQSIDTFIGATYTLSLYYSWGFTNAESAGGLTLLVQASGASSTQNFLLEMPDGSTPSGWVLLEGRFTATDSSTGIEFLLSCGQNSNAELYLDNIAIPPVPFPGSQAPTCPAIPNEILVNGDFDCDDSSNF